MIFLTLGKHLTLNTLKILILLLMVFGVACQKEYSKDSTNSPTNNILEPLLTKYIVIDTTLPAGLDTTEKYFIGWDNNRRPTNIKSIAFNGIDTIEIAETNLSYNGSDSLASKKITKYRQPGSTNTESDTSFFSISSGRITRDSSVTYKNNIFFKSATFNYTFSNTNNNTAIGTIILGSTIFTYSERLHKVRTGLNIVSENDTSTRVISLTPNQNENLSFQAAYVYLANPNPFYKVYAPMYVENTTTTESRSIYDIGAQRNLLTSKNLNVSRWYNTSPATLIESTIITFSYQSRTDGYPQVIREKMIDNTTNDTIYTKYLLYYQ